MSLLRTVSIYCIQTIIFRDVFIACTSTSTNSLKRIDQMLMFRRLKTEWKNIKSANIQKQQQNVLIFHDICGQVVDILHHLTPQLFEPNHQKTFNDILHTRSDQFVHFKSIQIKAEFQNGIKKKKRSEGKVLCDIKLRKHY